MEQANVVDRYNALCQAHRDQVNSKRARKIEAERLEAQLGDMLRKFKAKRRKAERKGR